jgi:hypothetical protein
MIADSRSFTGARPLASISACCALRQSSFARDGVSAPEELQRRVLQRAAYAMVAQRRPDGPHHHLLRLIAGHDQSADQHIIAGADRHPRRDVRKPRAIAHLSLDRQHGRRCEQCYEREN